MQVAGRKDSLEKLGYGTMKRISKVWFSAKRSSLSQIARSLYDSNSPSKARAQWQEGNAWFEFFCAFWSEIQDHYSPSLWQKNSASKLFIGANLWALQQVILLQLDAQAERTWKITETDLDFEGRFQTLRDRMIEIVTETLL